jgi:LmbE family N-acetylglucosaminyl deacetylase
MWIQSSLSSSRIERILIVIAHPDDESMFFSPIILVRILSIQALPT